MIKKYSLINNITGWVVFAIAAAVYLLTMEPSASLWDCGEFIASANKLEVGHPPGAPLFLMIARLFSMGAGSNVEKIAVMVNTMSALASATTILFLFWSITHIGRKFFTSSVDSLKDTLVVIAAGVVGALAYTFSDTFWFSAVEGEVYAMSSLFTAAVFWAILKWEDSADEPHNEKWIVLIAYLMGLSIGVHLLNLLAIPAIAFVYYFRKYKPTRNGVLATIAISGLALAFVLWGIIQGSFKVAAKVELFTVNVLGMPFNSGLLIYVVILIATLVTALYFSHRENKVVLNTIVGTIAAILIGIPFLTDNFLIATVIIAAVAAGIYFASANMRAILNLTLLAGTVIVIGYSSYAMIVVRSLANTPLDENNPENVFSLLSYLNREQYGDRPLAYGPTYNAPLDAQNPYSDGKETYIQKGNKYIPTSSGFDQNYDSRFMMFFPRMYSNNANHISAYKEWGQVKGKRIQVNGEEIIKPTFSENIRFFLAYQVNFMYFRYFMWNFAGRQNDEQGHGDLLNGNWISGINFIDSIRLGDQSLLPDYNKNAPSRNVYFFLPLLLGIAGAVYSFKYRAHDFTTVALLFFLTGLAIVLYLNQTPYQPRERDYAYAGSFYAFAIWIGLGTIALYRWAGKYMPAGIAATAAVLVTLPVPALMAEQNWRDHDRSGRYIARDLAYDYLITCKPNALIFTNGDNDTFPLWYLQEVEGVRTDVRVCCLPLMSTDWYGNQMKRRAYESAPIPIKMASEKYIQGTRDYLPVQEKVNKPVSLRQIMEFVGDDSPEVKVQLSNDNTMNYIPARTVFIDVDSAKVLANGGVKPSQAAMLPKQIEWKITPSYILKNEMFILDILSDYDWSRPIYYTSSGIREMLGLDKYYINEGFAYRFTPIDQTANGNNAIDTEVMYDNLMNRYRYGRMNEKDVFLCSNNLRTLKVIGLRDMFSQLSVALSQEGKKDSAVAVLDRAMELMPMDKVPYDYFMHGVAQAYYIAGAKDKADKIVEDYTKICLQELRFFTSLSPNMRISARNDEQRSAAIAGRLIQLARTFGQTKLSNDLENQLKLYVSI